MIDPKYLRNEIYINIVSAYKKIYAKRSVKNVYEFSKLVHDVEFEAVFSSIIMNEYHKYLFKDLDVYEKEHIDMSEIYSSFLHVINIYERDFNKKMNDYFKDLYVEKDIFAKSADEKGADLLSLFDGMIKDILGGIITNNSNIFQTLLYKLYLYKLSILD